MLKSDRRVPTRTRRVAARLPGADGLRPALYWGAAHGQRPQDFVVPSVPTWQRAAVTFLLEHGADAHPSFRAMGWADCRICGAQLGSMDLTSFGFVWPERTEHYVAAHAVWTPECAALLRRALARTCCP